MAFVEPMLCNEPNIVCFSEGYLLTINKEY